jgi:hypothetical protein
MRTAEYNTPYSKSIGRKGLFGTDGEEYGRVLSKTEKVGGINNARYLERIYQKNVH